MSSEGKSDLDEIFYDMQKLYYNMKDYYQVHQVSEGKFKPDPTPPINQSTQSQDKIPLPVLSPCEFSIEKSIAEVVDIVRPMLTK